MVLSQIDSLFAQMLSGDYADDSQWAAVTALSRMGGREVFNRSAELCKSENPLARARGADVLAQLGKTSEQPTNNFPEESYLVVSSLLDCEKDALPLTSAISALGHIGNPLAIPLIVQHVCHPKPEVRFHVACALGTFADDTRTIKALLLLMDDGDPNIRDWATFGLGVLGETDSDEIRDSLFLRINDPDEDTREEAMRGLSKRKDQRVLRPLIAILEQDCVPDRSIEAADLMLDGSVGDRADWTPKEYAVALRRQYSL
jgi:HEAT repeat protein